jgi:hypothetical protein
MKRYLTATALALVFASVDAKAELITNGNFSGGCHDQTCPGWTVTLGNGPDLEFNSTDDTKGVIIPANTGWVTYGGVLTTDDVISQVIPTVAGQMYQVSFKLGSNNGDVPPFC